MNAYVSKPIDKKQLFGTIEQVLGMRVWSPRAEDEAPSSAPNTKALSQLEGFISSL